MWQDTHPQKNCNRQAQVPKRVRIFSSYAYVVGTLGTFTHFTPHNFPALYSTFHSCLHTQYLRKNAILSFQINKTLVQFPARWELYDWCLVGYGEYITKITSLVLQTSWLYIWHTNFTKSKQQDNLHSESIIDNVYLGKPSIEKTRYNLEIFQIG